MNVVPQVFHERDHSLPIERFRARKRTEGGNSTSLINRTCGDAVIETKLARGGDKLLFLLLRHILINCFPMLGAG